MKKHTDKFNHPVAVGDIVLCEYPSNGYAGEVLVGKVIRLASDGYLTI